MTAKVERLGELHEIVTEEFISRIRDGEKEIGPDGDIVKVSCKPATLAAAVRFLQQNKIEVEVNSNGRFQHLANLLAASDEDYPN